MTLSLERSRHEGNEDFLYKLAAYIHAVLLAIKQGEKKLAEENDVKLLN